MSELICLVIGFLLGLYAKKRWCKNCNYSTPVGWPEPSHKDTTPIPASRFRAGKRRGSSDGPDRG